LNWGYSTGDIRHRQSARTTNSAVTSRVRDPEPVTSADQEHTLSSGFTILSSDELDLMLHQYGTGSAATADVLLDDETAKQLLNDCKLLPLQRINFLFLFRNMR
jgi:hypothetical protein